MAVVMIDSGAFSAWSRGMEISLDSYLDFCVSLPNASYYVNLDIIPPKLGRLEGSRQDCVEECCQQSWKNYRQMIKHLPKEKVLPVYHQQDGLHWLQRYLDFGVSYLGISPDKEISFRERLMWFQRMRKILVRDGCAVTKLHGFGTATYDSVRLLPWTSVDSSSPILAGGLGHLFVPRVEDGEFCYTRRPLIISCTDRVTKEKSVGLFDLEEQGVELGFQGRGDTRAAVVHLFLLSPLEQKMVERYLRQYGIGIGKREIVPVPVCYSLQQGERWANDEQKAVLRQLRPGVLTCHRRRKYLNILYFQEMGKAHGAQMYISGVGGISLRTEKIIDFRLLSFFEVQQLVDSRRALVYHGVESKEYIHQLWKRIPRPIGFRGEKLGQLWTPEERGNLLDHLLTGADVRAVAEKVQRSAPSLGAELSCLMRNKSERLDKLPNRARDRKGKQWTRFEIRFIWGYFRWGERSEAKETGEVGVRLLANALRRMEVEIREHKLSV